MSHVTKIKMKFTNLNDLVRAAEALGLERRDKKTFKWFNVHVGDYPLPEGFSVSDMGRCDVFALGVKDKPNAYEIGVCKARDGSDGYELLFDFWGRGYGLEDAIGEGGKLLQEEYALCHAEQQLIEAGYIVTRQAEDLCIEGL